jgi:small subunit ribosomal protein S1
MSVSDPTMTSEADEATQTLTLMEQFLNDPSLEYKSLKYGDVMDGVIMRIDRDEILVDIGSKSEGVVPSREFSSLTSAERDALAIGETILVFVVQPENLEGQAVVSIDRARQEKSWRRLQELYEANEAIQAEVTNYNKGGLLVNLDGVRGFVPASQVTEIRGGDDASKQADMGRLIGTKLNLKVIEINRHRNRLILSERQAMQERRDEMKEKLIEELKEGEVRHGRVSSICDFGAFVDIGGADGLVHLSELSWSRVRHPSEILRVGQEVDVAVLGINPQERKIALSLKRTQAEPWSQVGDKYEVGQLVRGTITQLANFGAFSRIEDGIEGLIHVSEITDERITHPKQIVKEGEELILRIIRIDPQRRRMGLSLRRALDTPDQELLNNFGEGILEERDRIVASINAALEAEGIEPGSGRDDDDDDEQASAPTATAPVATAEPQPSATVQEAVTAQVSPDAPMSAMEAAFAAAGAEVATPTEAVVENDAAASGEDSPATVEPAAGEAVAIEAPVDTEAPAAAEPTVVEETVETEAEIAPEEPAPLQEAAAELEAAAAELEEAVAEVEAIAETAGPAEVAEAAAAVEEAAAELEAAVADVEAAAEEAPTE